MWVMRLNIVDWGYFKIQTLQEILDSKSTSGGVLCIFGSRTFVPISWICKKQTSVSHSSTESEIISLDAGLRMNGLPALDLWELVIEVLGMNLRIPEPTRACARETGVDIQNTHKIPQVLDQNVDLSNIDQVPSNVHLPEKESQLYVFEDTEAVIQMIIKGRSPTMRHVSRTHRVALDWLFDRINLDPKVQIKCVESKNQLADILTKGSFTRDEWHNLLCLFNIMNDTTFSCSHFCTHSFLSAGKQSEISKRSQESSSPDSPNGKSESMFVSFRDNAYLWDKIVRVTPKSPGSTRDSQVGPWEGRSAKSGWHSVQHASGNREKSSEDSGCLLEAHASGNREYTRKVVQNKNQLRHDESTSEVSINSEKMHIWIWTRFMASSMQAALHMDPSYEMKYELFKNSEFENIKGLFGITRMMIEGNSEIKNVFLADVASSLWEKHVLLKEQAIKWTKAGVYVHSDSVLWLGQQHGQKMQ